MLKLFSAKSVTEFDLIVVVEDFKSCLMSNHSQLRECHTSLLCKISNINNGNSKVDKPV